MKKTVLSFAVLALLLAAFGPGADAGDQQTLTGEYVWNGGRPSKLTAVFTATDEARWRVAFQFRHHGERHVYRGTAEGSLDGELRGKVRTEDGGRRFTFRLENENGTLSGTHAEVFGRRESSTGTLSLKRPGQPSSDVL